MKSQELRVIHYCESNDVQFVSADAALADIQSGIFMILGVTFWHRSINAIRHVSILPLDLRRCFLVVDLDDIQPQQFYSLFPGVGFGNMPAQPVLSVCNKGEHMASLFAESRCFSLLSSERRLRDLLESGKSADSK